VAVSRGGKAQPRQRAKEEKVEEAESEAYSMAVSK